MDHLVGLFDTGPNGSAMLTTALPPEVCAVVDFHCDLCDLDISKHSDRCSALLASYASLASFSTTTNQRAIGGVDIYAPAWIPTPQAGTLLGEDILVHAYCSARLVDVLKMTLKVAACGCVAASSSSSSSSTKQMQASTASISLICDVINMYNNY